MRSAFWTLGPALISAEAEIAIRVTTGVHGLQKAGNRPDEYEDAFAIGTAARRLAIADGASDSYDSGRWARLLVDAFVDVPPAANVDGVRGWLAEPAREWVAGLNFAALPWNQQEKARLGAHSTFLGLEFDLVEQGAGNGAPCGAWRAMAVGDACLFHIRDQGLRAAFPLNSATAFGGSPALLTTNPAYRGASVDHLTTAQGDLRLGDTVILATDALAHWFLGRYEQGEQPWLRLPERSNFADFVAAQRAQRRLRNDDVTMIVVHFAAADAEQRLVTTTAIVPKRDSDRWVRWPC